MDGSSGPLGNGPEKLSSNDYSGTLVEGCSLACVNGEPEAGVDGCLRTCVATPYFSKAQH